MARKSKLEPESLREACSPSPPAASKATMTHYPDQARMVDARPDVSSSRKMAHRTVKPSVPDATLDDDRCASHDRPGCRIRDGRGLLLSLVRCVTEALGVATRSSPSSGTAGEACFARSRSGVTGAARRLRASARWHALRGGAARGDVALRGPRPAAVSPRITVSRPGRRRATAGCR